jgi:hypothetical protein
MDFARRYRFELAFAVVLFGVLGVFGGTWARQVQLRSARGELLHMVDGLRVAEIGYHRKHGNYLAVPAHPGAPPGEAAPWVAPTAWSSTTRCRSSMGGTRSIWSKVGFA